MPAPSEVLELAGGGRVVFTDVAVGNLSLATGEGHELGARRRDRLCAKLGLEWLCAGAQVHGSTVVRVKALHGTLGEPLGVQADGHATALPGVGAMVLAADCVPVAIGGVGAVATVHGGWRGLAAGVLEEGVKAVRELGADGDLEAIVGPCAGSCCYEVGAEVRHALSLNGPPGARHIDLAAIVTDRLYAAGVGQVRALGGCTICDERYFSHRREGARAGRQAGVAWLS